MNEVVPNKMYWVEIRDCPRLHDYIGPAFIYWQSVYRVSLKLPLDIADKGHWLYGSKRRGEDLERGKLHIDQEHITIKEIE